MIFQALPIVLRRIFQVGTVSVCLLLASCAGTPREEIFDSDGPTTEQIWLGGSERSVLLAEQYGAAGGNLDSWSRSVDRELAALFPELRNPRLLLYVFPHLTAQGYPVPGYSTAFYLHTTTGLFALPGEAMREGSLR